MALIIRNNHHTDGQPTIIQIKELHETQPGFPAPPLDPIKIEAGNFIVFLKTYTEHYKDFVRMILQDNVDENYFTVINHLENLAKVGCIEMMVLYNASTSYENHYIEKEENGEKYFTQVFVNTETQMGWHRMWTPHYVKIGPKEKQDSKTMNVYDKTLEAFILGKLDDPEIFDKLVAGGFIESYVEHKLPPKEHENFYTPVFQAPHDINSYDRH